MILIDVIDAERRKIVAALSPATDEPGPSRRSPGTAQPAPPPNLDPPDYDTSQAEAGNLNANDIEKKTQRGQRKLRRYLVSALVVYLVLSLSIGIPLFVVLRKNARVDALEDQEMWMKQGLQPPPPPPDGPPDISNLPVNLGSPVGCNNWTHVAASDSSGPYYQLQYTMPLTDTLYIRSNFSDLDNDGDLNSPVAGNLRVSVVNDTSQSNATVTVMMKDVGYDALQKSSVCLMGNSSTWGLSITIPDDADDFKFKYFFDVNLELPVAQAGPPLCNLVTYLPSFNQTFGSLDSYRALDTLDVEGSIGNLYFESVSAKTILVKASASSISGNFNATDSIFLETVLQPITANISLYNDGLEYDRSHLSVETGNSNISVNVNLYSLTNGSYCRPSYMTNLQTFSGSIDANYYHDSSLVASTLWIRASTTIEPARIFVDRVFEGTYDVHTSLAEAVVEKSTDLIDPSGNGRIRTYEDTYVSSSRTYGWVGWGERPLDGRILQQGHVEIISSLSPATLQLTDQPNTNGLSNTSGSKALDISL